MEANIYSQKGEEVGKVTLPEKIFGVGWNADLVKQVADSLLSSKRHPIAHTKTRGEVRGGGKKPWQQKGTGRARHGSIRSPIWVGGGVSGGPRNDKNFLRTVPKQMRVKALYSILSRKFKEGEVFFVDSLALPKAKTKEAVKSLHGLSKVKGLEHILTKRKNSTVMALSTKNRETERSFSNFGNIEVVEARNLNPLSLLQYKYLVIENPEKAFSVLPGNTK